MVLLLTFELNILNSFCELAHLAGLSNKLIYLDTSIIIFLSISVLSLRKFGLGNDLLYFSLLFGFHGLILSVES